MKGWTIAKLDELPKWGNGWIPVREHLGITAFGVNAWTKRDNDDDVIGAHDEQSTGHEELYFVFRGHAAFTVGEDEIDAPAGTFVVIKDPALRRRARPLDDDTIVLTVGGKPGEAFTISDWERNNEWNAKAFPLYNEQRYAEAAAVLRDGIAAGADNPNMHYNLACFAALAGETDDALEHLRVAFAADASLQELAETDSDLDSLRDLPGYPR